MSSPRVFLRSCLLLCCLLALAACSSKHARQTLPEAARLAVAGFTNPQNNWELLAGCLPEQCPVIPRQSLEQLNAMLNDELAARGRSYIPMADASRCQEIALSEMKDGQPREPAITYWLRVGKCLRADYLLVPQVMDFRERVGGEWGVEKPASVVMDIYLIDVANEALVGRYHYDETQQSLSSNLFDTGKFFSRGGKWVTAAQLAQEGIKEGLTELGL